MTALATNPRSIGAICRAVGDSSFWSRWGPNSTVGSGVDSARADALDTVWTYSAVTAIAEAVARLPRRLLDDADQLVESGPLTDLLNRPNDTQDSREFIELLVMRLLGPAGAVAIIKDRPSSIAAQHDPHGSAALPTRLFVAEASRFTPLWSAGRPHRALNGWLYIAPDTGERIPFAVDEVITIRLPGADSLSPLDGLSPQIAARRAIELDRQMGRFAAAYFANDATPSMVLTTDRPLTVMQIKQMTRQWEQRHKGASRAGHVAILHKGLKPMAAPSIRDLAFADLTKQTREAQTAPYNVPPIVLGIVDDANRSNSDAQLAMFILGPVLGHADRIGAAINLGLISAHPWPDAAQPNAQRMAWSRSRHAQISNDRLAWRSLQRERQLLARAFETIDPVRAASIGAPAHGLHLVFDADAHPTVIALKLERGQAAAKTLFDIGTPRNDIVDLLDLQLPRTDSGDVEFLPFSVAPAASIANPPQLSEIPPVSTPTKSADAHWRSNRAQVGRRNALIRGIRERHAQTFAPLASQMERLLATHLRKQRDGVLARLRINVKPDEIGRSTRAQISDERLATILFDLADAQGAIKATTQPMRQKTATVGLAQGGAEAGLAVAQASEQALLLVNSPEIGRLLAQSKSIFSLIEVDRHAAVRKVISDAFLDPEQTFNSLVQNLKQFYERSFTAAKRTALTETVKVLNGARHEGGKAAGANAKLWLTTSANVRPTHVEAQATYGSTPIPIDQPFIVGGAALQSRADPNGPLSEVINCQCVELFAFLDDSGRADPTTAIDTALTRASRVDYDALNNILENADEA